MNTKQLLLSAFITTLAFANANAAFDFDFDLSKTPSRGECIAFLGVAAAVYTISSISGWRSPVELEDKIIVSDKYFGLIETINAKVKNDASLEKKPLLIISRDGNFETRCVSGVRVQTKNESDCEEYDKLWNALQKKHAPKNSIEA